MLGLRLTDAHSATWEVVGQTCAGGQWVIQRVDAFGPSETVTAAELADRFEVVPQEPSQPSEEDGWRVLAERNAAASLAALRTERDRRPSPEDVFAQVADDAN